MGPDPSADAGLADAERDGGAVKAEIFCDGKRLNEDDHREATTAQRGQGDRFTDIFTPLAPPHPLPEAPG